MNKKQLAIYLSVSIVSNLVINMATHIAWVAILSILVVLLAGIGLYQRSTSKGTHALYMIAVYGITFAPSCIIALIVHDSMVRRPDDYHREMFYRVLLNLGLFGVPLAIAAITCMIIICLKEKSEGMPERN